MQQIGDMIGSMGHRVWWRARFLAGGNPFPLRQRLQHINPLRSNHGVIRLLEACRRRDRDGTEYFLLDGHRIYFRPDLPIRDEAQLLEGTLLVLREAFLFPDHFSSHVTIRPGDWVLDLGGNIGTSAMCYAKLAGRRGRVFSFEPVSHALLERNMRANGLKTVRVVPQGRVGPPRGGGVGPERQADRLLDRPRPQWT
jgi:hypothetical protein